MACINKNDGTQLLNKPSIYIVLCLLNKSVIIGEFVIIAVPRLQKKKKKI